MSTTTERASSDVAAFVERFIEAWAHPKLEGFAALVHPDVVLEQPMMPRMVGAGAQREGFRRLLEGFPGLRGEVLSWSGTSERLFIELRLNVPGRRPLEWTVVDRIRLEDGLVRERITYMDSLPLLLGVLTRPWLWRPLARMQLGRR